MRVKNKKRTVFELTDDEVEKLYVILKIFDEKKLITEEIKEDKKKEYKIFLKEIKRKIEVCS